MNDYLENNRKLRRELHTLWPLYESSVAELKKLRARVAELESRVSELDLNDRRYMWIRDAGWMLIGRDRGCGPEWPLADELDRRVDAALKEAAAKGDANASDSE